MSTLSPQYHLNAHEHAMKYRRTTSWHGKSDHPRSTWMILGGLRPWKSMRVNRGDFQPGWYRPKGLERDFTLRLIGYSEAGRAVSSENDQNNLYVVCICVQWSSVAHGNKLHRALEAKATFFRRINQFVLLVFAWDLLIVRKTSPALSFKGLHLSLWLRKSPSVSCILKAKIKSVFFFSSWWNHNVASAL